MERPKEPGWMHILEWAKLSTPEVPSWKAYAYCNPESKKTATKFRERDVDRRGKFDVYVWNQPGAGRPELFNPSGASRQQALRKSAPLPEKIQNAPASGGVGQKSAHSSHHG